MIRFTKSFTTSEDGAVTVDWVVLTAIIIALATLIYFGIQTATISLSGNTSSAMSSATISTGSNNAPGGIVVSGTAGGGS